jgi:hypothetical protein
MDHDDIRPVRRSSVSFGTETVLRRSARLQQRGRDVVGGLVDPDGIPVACAPRGELLEKRVERMYTHQRLFETRLSATQGSTSAPDRGRRAGPAR